MTTYTLCKSIIERETYLSKDDMQTKLDIFFMNKRINDKEYSELTELLKLQ